MISKTGVLQEVIKRNAAPVAAKPILLDPNFPEQNAFIQDTNRFLFAQCGRRSGKTNGLAIRFFNTLEKHPKSQCIYLALTLDSAREILWPVLQEYNDKFSLGCTFIESKLTMKHPNGSTLKLFGADMKNFIKRLKGRKYPGVGIDEAQDFGTHLESLINDVLTPSIADYPDGWLALTGTPGPVPNGYFFEVTQNGRFGYSGHKWTMLENIYMPNPEAFIADLMKKREWVEGNPTLEREYRNRWVLDPQSLWVRYSAQLNHYDALPAGHKWNYVMGVDIGFRDADAIAVLAWSETTRDAYLVEELITAKQGMTSLIAQIDGLQKKYGVYKIVLDEGGLGKKLAEDIRQRFGCPLQPADKAHKQTNVDLLNDDLRLGRFKAKSDSRFALDSYLVQIDYEKSSPSRIVLKKSPHSDIIDSVLYAFRDLYAYTHEPEKPKAPAWGTKAWADQTHDAMFEAELEGHLAELERLREQGE